MNVPIQSLYRILNLTVIVDLDPCGPSFSLWLTLLVNMSKTTIACPKKDIKPHTPKVKPLKFMKSFKRNYGHNYNLKRLILC